MANLEALLNDLANLDAQHDLEGLRRVREEIIKSFPNSDEAVEATYKIGLDLLFRERDIQNAMDAFLNAAMRKHPFWSAAARTSLGLCYYHQKRTQKALFELRRVAYPEVPSAHSVTALTFIESIFQDEGNHDEAARARKDRIGQLEKLIDSNKGNPAERGYHLYQLGLALKDHGEGRRADEVLQKAKSMGPSQLGADLYRSVIEALE